MKKIPLTKGQVALVDDDMFDYLNQWKWQAYLAPNNKYYARRSSRNSIGHRDEIRMHRLVIGALAGQEVDHINRNTLDNTLHNLRLCSRSQNNINSAPRSYSQSGLKGVCKRIHKKSTIWEAGISMNGKNIYLGTYNSPLLAVEAYNAAATKIYGEYAYLNTKVMIAAGGDK
jgi:hypothetical protein